MRTSTARSAPSVVPVTAEPADADDPAPRKPIVVTVGTCGPPLRINFPGLPDSDRNAPDSEDGKRAGQGEVFEGDVLHSSELDDASLEGKRVIVIGSGASGVEAVQTALEKGAKGCVMLARDDKVCQPGLASY